MSHFSCLKNFPIHLLGGIILLFPVLICKLIINYWFCTKWFKWAAVFWFPTNQSFKITVSYQAIPSPKRYAWQLGYFWLLAKFTSEIWWKKSLFTSGSSINIFQNWKSFLGRKKDFCFSKYNFYKYCSFIWVESFCENIW